ncbi:TonB-dependent siderophore receptor [Flagellimonas zhangzhouensis]|uniref:Iron complex outermembrane recepter protein n=1 Tax=Flagellimonas zhangzhouensis TaxID=1073328 RepID=A0A1H2UH71_9FLAO|nr:TonB-dependent siderophore receptor [Allomuricauda zhangzhouensis]SDQ17259.1 iron complex outermembrane recepter protein [Allomuricauda zhangzhouensis]SDW55268.1 iron complex outermembrane recepter protein [Allomuricauda zhangzhouensis]
MLKNLLSILLLSAGICSAQQGSLSGSVTDSTGEPIPFAHVILSSESRGTSADQYGFYEFKNLKPNSYEVVVSSVGYHSMKKTVTIGSNSDVILNFTLQQGNELEQVEVFGNRYEHPDKIEALTRLPLAPYEQIQSISVVSEKLIEQQGNLTISEATKNVPGVYTFATYGNQRESMSSRGFRGIPILKNGVRINSDFRGVGVLTDMQGVDNIQVLKGAASITQGVATDLGSPGGVINIVTKTPRYQFGGNVSGRVGSFGQARTTYDVYGPLNESKNLAFRIDGTFEKGNSFRKMVEGERFYINPSLEWRIDNKSKLTLEMDYLDDSRTPDIGTVNLGENDTNAIYDLPYNQFLGFETDRSNTMNQTYSIRFNRDLDDKLNLQVAYYHSNLDLDSRGASLGNAISDSEGNSIYNQHIRGFSNSERSDKNSVLQVDLIGDKLETGKIKHTFQVGMDYRSTSYSTFSQTASAVDTIDVFSAINNTLPDEIAFSSPREAEASSRSLGFVAQDVITFNSWLKSFLGIRYSTTKTDSETESVTNDAFNPLAGVIVTPYKNINVFASYTNSAYPRTASRLDENGNPLGNERFDQLEAGIKTNWLDNKLRFNFTYFKINNKNINLPVYDENWVATGFYQQGGNDERKGVELELTGRIMDNLELIGGYSYIDAQYKEHTSFVYGSAPLNTPKHTFNLYLNYGFTGALDGLTLGGGAYYTGKRPINDWSAGAVTHEGIVPNQKPFDVDAYTMVNLQAAYRFNRNWNFRVIANNIFDQIGYNAYRTRFINQTDPFNLAGVVTYSF